MFLIGKNNLFNIFNFKNEYNKIIFQKYDKINILKVILKYLINFNEKKF